MWDSSMPVIVGYLFPEWLLNTDLYNNKHNQLQILQENHAKYQY